MKCQYFFLYVLFWLSACGQSPEQHAASAGAVAPAPPNPLEAYVQDIDPAYGYERVHVVEGEGYTMHVLRMTSQRWLDSSLVRDPVWWHYVQVVVPEGATGPTGLLYIGGGSREAALPEQPDPLLLQSALATRTITAGVHNVPNQPLQFVGDDYGPRYEDEIIAYGWRHFMEGGARDDDARWLARLPMTTAAVRAMDAVSDFTGQTLGTPVERFVVAGGSKRGWTTWTTAIVDERVVGIAPFVIDLLNVVPSFQHHWRAYGFWAPAVGDYEREGVMEWQESREYRRLLQLVEPYSYRWRLSLPKLLINAAGDQFFLPDSWQFYYRELMGETHLRYVPNTGHSLDGTDALETFIAFYHGIVQEQPRPRFTWYVEDGELLIETNPDFPPRGITLWQAANPDTRDFRISTIGKGYEASDIAVRPDGRYRVGAPAPESGWRAFFVELTFDTGAPFPFKSTTGVVVTPDRYPHPPFVSEAPMGTR